jgi:hypothetical protein
VSRTSAADAVTTPFAGQTLRSAPDITFFDSHITPMMRDISLMKMVVI